ncbi:hypothetical protein [Vibrio tetraodonis]|uniref:hypothetical protein n=1 Tax=Vibrio tetraodonis TaxID=2231647 RepID=UPI001F1EA9E7|nr:hypothetical protein [Vibrio tetraodonis]
MHQLSILERISNIPIVDGKSCGAIDLGGTTILIWYFLSTHQFLEALEIPYHLG